MNNSTNCTAADVEQFKLSVSELPDILVFLLGFFGNLIVIIALRRERLLRSSLNYLVLNLSFCNVCVVTFLIPFELVIKFYNHDYPFGQVGCTLILPLATYAINVSVVSLLVITVDRYVAIVHAITWPPHHRHTVRTIVLIHVYGLITIIPYMTTVKVGVKNCTRVCEETWSETSGKAYTIVLFLLQYAIPLPVMIVLYTKAWIHLKRQNDRTIRLSEEARTARSMSMVSQDYPRRRASNLTSTYRNEFKNMLLSFCFAPCRYQMLRRQQRQQGSMISSVGDEYFVANYRRRQTIRTFLIFLLIIVIFAVSSLPNQIKWLLITFHKKHPSAWANHTINVLHYANCVTNPFIFGGLNKYFWQAYKRVVFCVKRADQENFDVTTGTYADSPTRTSLRKKSSELFKEGIITRNPVIFITAGSMDSVFNLEDDTGDNICLGSEPMSLKFVQFEESNRSKFRKISTITTHSDVGWKKHRKISAALVEDRQRKLTLPPFTGNRICSKEKEIIQKISVPSKVNEKEFTFNSSFALLPPPSRKSSASLREKFYSLMSLNNPFRKSLTSNNMDLIERKEREHRKISKTLIAKDRARKLTLPILNKRNKIPNIRKYSEPVDIIREEPDDNDSREHISLLPHQEEHTTIATNNITMPKRKNGISSNLNSRKSNTERILLIHTTEKTTTDQPQSAATEELSSGEESNSTCQTILTNSQYISNNSDTCLQCKKEILTEGRADDKHNNYQCLNKPDIEGSNFGDEEKEIDLVLEAIENCRESRMLEPDSFLQDHLIGLLEKLGKRSMCTENEIDYDRTFNFARIEHLPESYI